MNPWKPALERYRKYFGRFPSWQPGHLRLHKHTWYVLPRWMDNAESLVRHVWLRVQGKCITCQMRGMHKMSCYHSWRIRDDLIALHLWRRRT